MTAHWRTPAGLHTSPARLPVEGRLPSFEGATGWLNSSPLATADLQGRVTLVSFWTYTCINWLRSHAYVRAWAEKYKQHGLVVIGAHTPEFPFERDIDNVRRAAEDMKIRYPVAVDSNYAIWQAFENSYWLAFYFRRSARPHSPPPIRRGLIPAVGENHPASPGRDRFGRHHR